MKFYKEILMDHYQNPRNRGHLEKPVFSTVQYNPSCGDSISFEGIIEDGIIKALAFEGKGCVISLATASMLTEFFVGKKIEEVLGFQDSKISEIIGMPLGPMRIKCALLALMALKEGILEYKAKHA
ncbi:MAG: SUF system FeS assembly protein, NifU family [candidate division TM6 bacterium GW2011_GWF2_30_66]|jgi:nitrogen fixation NifU-like protein|nr:MAG: SUF system FeS assembly protein, NifU family [candidate division TM6 bacterium GW2011_GWF2_30_66]